MVTLVGLILVAGVGCIHTRRTSLPPDRNGLLVHYTFDEGTGDVVGDQSGHGHDAKIHGAQFVQAAEGFALMLDGKDDFVVCDAVAKRAEKLKAFTLTLWIRPAGRPVGEPAIIGFGSPVYEHAGITYYSAGEIHFYVKTGGNSVSSQAPYRQWSHVAAVFDGRKLRLYVHGEIKQEKGHDTSYPNYLAAGQKLYLGVNNDAHYHGQMDDVRVYSRALLPAEIHRIFIASAPKRGIDLPRTDAEIAHEIKIGYQQAIRNPFFRQWADGRPVAWTVDDGVRIKKGTKGYEFMAGIVGDSAVLENPPPGKGIHQDVEVQPGVLYALSSYITVQGNGNAIIRVDGASGTFYAGARYSRYELFWHEVAAVRPKPQDSTVRISVIRDPADDPNGKMSIILDNTTLSTLVPPTQHLKPVLAKPALLMYGFRDEMRAWWDEVFQTFNIIVGLFYDADRIRHLENGGIVVAESTHASFHHRHAIGPDGKMRGRASNRDNLIASLGWPFVETLEGRMPGGFKAMAWDEMGGWPNGSRMARTLVDVLRETRRRFPNKLIMVWGTNDLGQTWPTKGGPFEDYDRAFANAVRANSVGGRTPVPNPADRPRYPDCWEVVRGIRDYADLFMQEAYLYESSARCLDKGPSMAANLKTLAPGILKKTILVPMICDSTDEKCSDDPRLLFKEFLEAQVRLIRIDSDARDTIGIGLYPLYRADLETITHLCALVRHYYHENRLDYYGLGRMDNPVADPSFEAWSVPFGAPGKSVVDYGEGTAPDNPPRGPGPGFFGRRVLRMDAEGRPHRFTQRVRLHRPGPHVLSAWWWSKGKEPLRLSVNLIQPDGSRKPLAQRDTPAHYSAYWARGRVSFNLPAPPRKTPLQDIEIAISDAAVKSDVSLFVDCVEIEPQYGNNRPCVVKSVEPKTLKADGDNTITVRGENLTAAMRAWVGDTPCGYTRWLNARTITFKKPKDIKPGKYDVTVEPYGNAVYRPLEKVTVKKAIEVK